MLKTRKKEHIANIKKPAKDLTVLSHHRINTNHRIDWNNISILDTEQSFHKRLTSEMIHIKRQEFSMNKQNDTDRFPDIFFPIINNYSPSH